MSDTTEQPHRSGIIAILVFAAVVIVLVIVVLLFSKKVPQHAISLTFSTGSDTAAYLYDTDTHALVPAGKLGSDAPLGSVVSKTGSVAYVCDSGTAQEAVCVWDPASMQRKVISHNSYASKSHLAWSPDGADVVYVALTGSLTAPADAKPESSPSASSSVRIPPPFLDTDQWSVFFAHADGSSEQKIAHGSTAFFSPDGSTVFYLERRGIFAFNIRSGNAAPAWPLTGGFSQRFMEIAISPDGTKLAWSDTQPGSKEGRIRVYTVRSWQHLYMQLDVAVIARRAWSLAFSPDSASLAFVQYGSQNQVQLWIAPLSGSSTPVKAGEFSAHGRDASISDWY